MNFWANRRVTVTGGAGFLGSHIVDRLNALNAIVSIPRSKDFNLTRFDAVCRMYQEFKPEIVIHAAAAAGGIGWNQENPATALHDNLMMGLNLMENATYFGIKKFVQIGSVCAYPLDVPMPTTEDFLWSGYPEPTNAPYGIAKRVLSEACKTYAKERGLNAISLIPVNLYGPRDDFDLKSGHVIANMIRKFVDAKENDESFVKLWGTGTPTREFIYVEDCADAIILATENYNSTQPINIGSGEEISICNLADLISTLIDYRGLHVWDISKPNGQPKRCFSSLLAKEKFGFEAKTKLLDGLQKTIKWYKQCEK